MRVRKMLIDRKSFEGKQNRLVTDPRLYAFLRKEQPSVKRALPPVGCERTWAQEPQTTTVWACEKTVVMAKQPGHLTSMKNELGLGTSRLSLWQRACCSAEGLRRSTARVYGEGGNAE